MKSTKIITLFFASMLLTFSGCNPTSPKSITPMPKVVTDSDHCPVACKKLSDLKCPEAEPINTHFACREDSNCQNGETCNGETGTCWASCETFCRNTQAEGVWLSPACVENITSCDQVDSCPR